MYSEKFLLFTSKPGNYKTSDAYDANTWVSTDAAIYPLSTFKGMRPGSVNTIDLWFEGGAKVTLNIKNGNHVKVMSIIANTVSKSDQGDHKELNLSISKYIFSNT